MTVVRESSLGDLEPFVFGARCLFSRTGALGGLLQPQTAPAFVDTLPHDRFESISGDFWFKAMLAAHKVARDDLLVALHLSLDLVRDCAVLCMGLRDRNLGTDHHRWGHEGGPFVDQLSTAAQPYSAEGILDSIEQSAVLFDDLAAQVLEGYEAKREPLVRWVAHVRRSRIKG